MSEKRSIENLIKDQLKIFRTSGLKNQKVTISVPKVTQDERIESIDDLEVTSILTALSEILGYMPSDLNSTLFFSDNMTTVIITFLFLG